MFFSESADQLSHCKKLIARKPYHQISLGLNSSERFRSSYDPAGIEIKLNVIVMVRRKHRELTFNVRPLRAHRERPDRCGRRTTEQRDERAPFQLIELHPVPASQGRIAGYRIGEDQSGGNGNVFTTWRMSEVGSSLDALRRGLHRRFSVGLRRGKSLGPHAAGIVQIREVCVTVIAATVLPQERWRRKIEQITISFLKDRDLYDDQRL